MHAECPLLTGSKYGCCVMERQAGTIPKPLLDFDAGVFRKGGRHRLEAGWRQSCVRCARGIHGEDSGSELFEG